jgi:hypothetical protein
MAMLFVRCHACHEPFPTGIAHDQSARGDLELLNVLEKCPRCGQTSRYATHEFYFPPNEPAQVDQPLDPGTPLAAIAAGAQATSDETEPPHDQGPPVGNRNRPVNVLP